MNELRIFSNPEFGSVRTAMIEGEIHFAGTDVAKALGYSIPSKAVQTHCHNVLKWKVGARQERILPQEMFRLFLQWSYV